MRPFSIKIEPDPLGARWFRWRLFEAGELLVQSQFSYPTRRQAKLGARVAKQERASQRRGGMADAKGSESATSRA
jgi:hypothetical protein